MNIVWANPLIKKPPKPKQKSFRAPVRSYDEAATFKRDHFTCRYKHCQRPTIHLSVLKQLSRIFPDILSYQRNWRPVNSHILYWCCSTSIEHIVAFPFGGTSAPENLITSCYQCNDIKNYLPLEVLGWTITNPATSVWDGLLRYLKPLQCIHPSVADHSHSQFTHGKTSSNTTAPIHLSQYGNVALKTCMFIQAQLPGKNSKRSYRIENFFDSVITLCEMWRSNKDRIWVASKNKQSFDINQLEYFKVLRNVAPLEGSIN